MRTDPYFGRKDVEECEQPPEEIEEIIAANHAQIIHRRHSEEKDKFLGTIALDP